MAASMPKIARCEMTDCSYNKNKECHTMAIRVTGSHPRCDTYFKTSSKGGIAGRTGGVCTCKAGSCRYNNSFECSASGINVGAHSGHAECVTYATR